jgi:hypothetical protein
MIHLYTKYELNPSNHYWKNERKLSLSRVWRTDGRTDGEPDGHHHIIIRRVFNGRIKNPIGFFSPMGFFMGQLIGVKTPPKSHGVLCFNVRYLKNYNQYRCKFL